MKGIELCEKYYNQVGKPMLERDFSELIPFISVGIAGSGSECLGFDDEISHDHDFEPGFCIFIPDEDILTEKQAFELQKAYNKLPREFMGYERSLTTPVGGNRHGVIRTPEFFVSKSGKHNGILTIHQWFSVPENALLEATNGKIFEDNYGEITMIRDRLKYFPEDIRLKKIAGNLLIMGQSGQYNYPRCLKRKETAAAQLCITEFVKAAINTIFLLNRQYQPYYKWIFKSLRGLDKLSDTAEKLEYLITSDNCEINATKKQELIEKIQTEITNELFAQGIVTKNTPELEAQAYAVNNTIQDNEIRNLHILYGI